MINLHLPPSIRDVVDSYIRTELLSKNPYFCDEDNARSLAAIFWETLAAHGTDRDVAALIGIIEVANSIEGGVLPYVLRNGPQDARDTLLGSADRVGYDYGENPLDRQKTGFVAEWFCWCMSTLLNHDAVIHPAEHGGKNRFHLISPIPAADKSLRTVGASTGGGEFPQHSDATVYHEMRDRTDLDRALTRLGTDVDAVAEILERDPDTIYDQVLCGMFVRVDMTILAGVLNLETMTHVALPGPLEAHLRAHGLSSGDIHTLANMPTAHLAGPADGDISGYVGNICPPLYLGSRGELLGSCINSAPRRMIYVGRNPEHARLFERFIDLVRSVPVSAVLMQPGDYLFLPNAYFYENSNVTHGRGQLSDTEYNIPIANGKVGRRIHCRQYAVSRSRSGLPSFLSTL